MINYFNLLMRRFMCVLIRGYQLFLSPYIPARCRFIPTCSEYAIEAINRFGLWRGGSMALKRFVSCRPGGKCGYDPVPQKK